MHRLLSNAKVYEILLKIDHDLASAVRAEDCPRCGGVLHVGDYPRAPRGAPTALPEGYDKRFSFCCAEEGCRARCTPPSVRFFGRRWYLAPVFVVLCALQHGVTRARLTQIQASLSDRVSRRTLARWRRWWLEAFTSTPCWRVGRGRFMPPVHEKRLPQTLLDAFSGPPRERLRDALRFLSPVTTGVGARSLVGAARR